MFRPAALGRDPEYALTDPGREYIDGVAETFFGPLAARWGVEGELATLAERTRLYQGLTPDGRGSLLDSGRREDYRPVFGGNFHPPKTLTAWMASQPDAVRLRAERAFFECCAEVVRERIVPDAPARVGAERVPAEVAAVGFTHKTNSAGHYHPHYLVEVHNAGRTADGSVCALDGKYLFEKQRMYSVEVESKVLTRFGREFGLAFNVTAQGLEVRGLEAMRGVKTPRQEEMAEEMARKGLPDTPKTRHYAGAKTHRPRDPRLTVREALDRTLAWLRAKGIDARKAVTAGVQKTSLLMEERKARASVKAAAKSLAVRGQTAREDQLREMSLREGLRRRADPKLVEGALRGAKKEPSRYGLTRLQDGTYTTNRTEASRGLWRETLRKHERRGPRPPTPLAYHGLLLGASPPTSAEFRAAEDLILGSRVAVASAPDGALRTAVRLFQADNRRVFAVATDRTERQIRQSLGVRTDTPEAFAARIGKTPRVEVFREMRRHHWQSLRHVERLAEVARAPKLRLDKDDVIVLDARHASHHAIRDVARKAKEAGATVLLVSEEKEPLRSRTIRRDDRQPGR